MISAHSAEILNTAKGNLHSTEFSELFDKLKARYRQMAEYLGIICRVDVHMPSSQIAWLKSEKTINAILREIMAMDKLIAVSIVSYEDADNYYIQITGHVQSRPWFRPEGISPSIIVNAETKGLIVKNSCRSSNKLSYDISLSTID